MVFMSAKQKAKKEQKSEQLKNYHATERFRKAKEKADDNNEVTFPCQIKPHQEGRRTVDLKTVAKNMWCSSCQLPLTFRNLVSEDLYGFASRFKIRCFKCLDLITVDSDHLVPDPSNDGRALFAVNCKAALGCLDAGIGPEQINKLFSTMNLPTICANTYKLAEERVGPAVVAAAKESCREAIALEKELTLSKRRLAGLHVDSPPPSGSEADSEDPDDPDSVAYSTPKRPRMDSPTSAEVPVDVFVDREQLDLHHEDVDQLDLGPCDVTASYDFGWDKRGNGFKYDSLSGRGSLIGSESKKVLGFQHYSKYCAMCARGHDPEDHDCVRNYVGSSKGMEPAAAVELILNNPDLDAAGVRVTSLIGDRDSSTIAALRAKAEFEIQKIVDMNHNIKGVNNPLWELKLKRGFTFLTGHSINYIKRCFQYAIQQNKGDVEGVRRGIMNVREHIFGNHDSCNTWCKAKGNPNYEYKFLPGYKALSDKNFYDELTKILQKQVDNAEQLAPAGSSLPNESFNAMCNARAPKSRFYAGTKSGLYRVSAAVCTKNMGSVGMERAIQLSLLSPSRSNYRERLERTRQLKRDKQGMPEVKKRRLFLKMQGSWSESTCNSSEGLTYVSGMSNTMERAAAATAAASYPDPKWLPESTTLLPTCKYVIIDLETGGFAASASTIQIAAKLGDKEFSVNILPAKKIDPRATAVTGLEVKAGKLYRHGKLLTTVPEKRALLDFLNFLKMCGDQVVLVGHNITKFDAPRIVKLFTTHNMGREFCSVVFGFVDTMPIIKQGKMCKQELLATTYLKGPKWDPIVSGAHDALIDCILLDGLLHYFKKHTTLKAHVHSMRAFLERQSVLKRKKELAPSLHGMRQFKVSAMMIGRMAETGVTVEELTEEYSKHGRKGLEVCLGVQLNGHPRVTTRKNIIDNVERFVVAHREGL